MRNDIRLTGADYRVWRLSDRDKYAVDPRTVTYLYPDRIYVGQVVYLN